MNSILLALLLGTSLCGTVFAWYTMRESQDPRWFKVLLAVIVAVPVLGPIMWLFTASMPSEHRYPGWPRFFKGPLAPNPTSPRWLTQSHRGVSYIAGTLILGVHVFVLLILLRATFTY